MSDQLTGVARATFDAALKAGYSRDKAEELGRLAAQHRTSRAFVETALQHARGDATRAAASIRAGKVSSPETLAGIHAALAALAAEVHGKRGAA